MFKLGSILTLALLLSTNAFAHNASSDVLAISCGASAASGIFAADEDFSGGSVYPSTAAVNTSNVINPAPQAVYQNTRYGNFTYTIPGLVAGGTYTVRLHFAETYFNTVGSRVFNTSIQGTQVLANFDIVAAAGGENVAIVKQFSAVADGNGFLSIVFTTVTGNAQVNGIEIVNPGTSPVPVPNPSYNLSLSSDKATYAAGSTATVLLTLSGTPSNPDYDFFLSATFAGNSIAITPISAGQFYSITPALTAGSTAYSAQVYLENSSEARALNEAISYYQGDVAKLQAQLATTTDPNTITTLNAEIAHDQDRLAATQAQLSAIRTAVGSPVVLPISAH